MIPALSYVKTARFFNKNTRCSSTSRTTTMSAVDDWVVGNGGIVDHRFRTRSVASSSPGVRACEREVVAGADIGSGECVLGIPRACILTKVRAEQTQAAQALRAAGETLSNDGSYLAVLLSEALSQHNINIHNNDNGNDDIYTCVVANLPPLAEYGHLPLFWGADDLAELKGSSVLSFLDIRKTSIHADYGLLCVYSEGFREAVSEETFWWLYAAVASRTFSFHTDAHYEVALMVPMADMLNDDGAPDLDWEWDEARDLFTLTTLRPVAKDEPLTISYGRSANFARLFNYGFCADADLGEELALPSELSSHQCRLALSLATLSAPPDGASTVSRDVDADAAAGSWYDTFVNAKVDAPALSRAKFSAAVADAAPLALNEKVVAFKSASWAAVLNLSAEGGDGGGEGVGSALLSSSVACQLSVGSADAATSALSLVRVAVIPEVGGRRAQPGAEDGEGEGELEYTELLRRIDEALALEDGAPPRAADSGDGDAESSARFGGAGCFAADRVARRPISWGNERRAMRAFRTALLAALAAFPTTLSEDSALLAHDAIAAPLSNNKRNAVVCRMGEKKVFGHYVRVADLALRYMDSPGRDFGEYCVLLEETLSARD